MSYGTAITFLVCCDGYDDGECHEVVTSSDGREDAQVKAMAIGWQEVPGIRPHLYGVHHYCPKHRTDRS